MQIFDKMDNKMVNRKEIEKKYLNSSNDELIMLFTKHRISSNKQSAKTNYKKVKRRIIHKNRRTKRVLDDKKTLSHKMRGTIKKECLILDGLYPQRKSRWKKFRNRKPGNKDINLNNFSFIDNPINTINNLRELSEGESIYSYNSCQLNFNDTTIYDMSTYLLLGNIIKNMFPFVTGGIMNQNLKQFMKPLKIDKYFSIETDDSFTEHKNLWAMPIISKTDNNTIDENINKNEARDNAATDVCNKFNEWLDKISSTQTIKLKLSEKGEYTLRGIVGEVLDNAEYHAFEGKKNKYGKWKVSCFMEHTDGNYKCCLAFFNGGEPIYKTINNTKNKDVKQDLDNYIDKHKKTIDKNLLSTIFALQDKSTRKKETVTDKGKTNKHGLGFMHMVEFIKDVSNSKKAKIAIISGNSYIKFCDSILEKTSTTTLGKRFQWFNENNSRDIAPDSTYAFNLPFTINGTIITSRFYMGEDMFYDKKV